MCFFREVKVALLIINQANWVFWEMDLLVLLVVFVQFSVCAQMKARLPRTHVYIIKNGWTGDNNKMLSLLLNTLFFIFDFIFLLLQIIRQYKLVLSSRIGFDWFGRE